jgi:hypothetical protein
VKKKPVAGENQVQMLGKTTCADKRTPSITAVICLWHKELSLKYNFKHLNISRPLLLGWMCLLLSISSFAQTPTWHYGIMPSFHIGVVKPVAQDSFSTRSAVGLSAFIEYKNASNGLSLGFGYNQNRIIEDRINLISIFHSLDMPLDYVKYLSEESKTAFLFGVIPSYNIARRSVLLDGSSPSGSGLIQEELPFRLDLGLKLGLSLEMSPGVRLQVNYLEYIKAQQTVDFVDAKGDLVQIGLQLRFNEMKHEKLEEIRTIEHIQNLKNAALIFVIPTEAKDLEKFTESKEREAIVAIKKERMKYMVQAIHAYYDYSNFYIIRDLDVQSFKRGSRSIFLDTALNTYEVGAEAITDYYMAVVGESFAADNKQTRSGIFVYDRNGDILKAPFPYFTPYPPRDAYMDQKVWVYMMFNKFTTSLHTLERSILSD